MNKLKGLFVEFHILQSFPSTCLNRDDMGSPKNAFIGGVERARVSSQCWKRAVRLAMHDFCGVNIGTRTKMVAKLILDECIREGATEEQALRYSNKICTAFVSKADDAAKPSDSDEAEKSDALTFLSESEVKALAKAFKDVNFDIDAIFPKQEDDTAAEENNESGDNGQTKKKDKAKKTGNGAKKKSKDETLVRNFVSKVIGSTAFGNTDRLDGLDIALFGRMIAQSPYLDINAASSFAHAISTHEASREIDYFTAVADMSQSEKGAEHLGTNEFNSATYYRYVSIDLGQLFKNLAGTNIDKAIEAFTKALFLAVPNARQSTFAGHCPWNFARVLVRRGQPVQVSFDSPVVSKGKGYVEPSVEALNENIDHLKRLYGSCYGERMDRVFGKSEDYSIDELISDIQEVVRKEIGND